MLFFRFRFYLLVSNRPENLPGSFRPSITRRLQKLFITKQNTVSEQCSPRETLRYLTARTATPAAP